jgi:predicted permease
MGNDIRFALRVILSHRWFSAAVVATLALGIGLNTMVFTLVNAVLFKPVPVPGGARLVAVRDRNLTQSDDSMRVSYPDFRDYRAQSSSFESLEAATDEEGTVSENSKAPEAFRMERTSTGLFDMLHISPTLGRGFVPADGNPGAAPVLLIGYGIWKERYGSSPSVIGRAVRVNEKPATIIGVMPDGFKFPSNVDMWMPLIPTPELESRTERPLQLFAMLKPGTSKAQAQAELDGIAARIAVQFPNTDKDIGVTVRTFHEQYNGGGIRMVFLLMLGAVGFVLLIACANVANMMLSRALGRQREMSIRSALGATRWRMMRQLLIESVLLSVMGGACGLALAVVGVHWFGLSVANVGKPYWIQFTVDYQVCGYFAALCILSGLLFGIAPALRSSSVEINSVLKEGARSVGRQRGGWLATILVVFQFALTLVLLTGAGVFVRSLMQVLAANPNVPSNQIMTARIGFPETRYKDAAARERFYDQLLPRLRAIPGVTHVALGSDLPGLGAANQDIEIEHAAPVDPAHRPSAAYVLQSPGYLATINLPILRGRDFNETDGTPDHRAAIVTRACAEHFWPGQDAIGKRFRFYDDKKKPGDWITVVGATADIDQELNEPDPKPLLYVPYRQEGWNGVAMLVESSSNPISAVRAAVENLDPDLPLHDVYKLPQAIQRDTWFLHLFSEIFAGFAVIALLMASVGIYAVIAHATGRRTQEIGVRIALGATAWNIVSLVMKRGLGQIGAGLALGMAGAIPVARLMHSAVRTSSSESVVFVSVGLVLAIVGLFACWLPARRAAALDPVKAIRYE